MNFIKSFIVRRKKAAALGEIPLTPDKALTFWIMAGGGSRPILRFYIEDPSFFPTRRDHVDEMIAVILGAGGKVEVDTKVLEKKTQLPYASAAEQEQAHAIIRREAEQEARRARRATILIVTE